MRLLRPGPLTGLLLALGALTALLHLGAEPAPHRLDAAALARLILGLPVVLWAPGAPLAAWAFRRDLRARSGEGLDLLWTLVAGVALQIPLHALHFAVLRPWGAVGWPALLALQLLETAALLYVLRAAPPFAPPRRPQLLAAAAAALPLAALTATHVPHLTRDASWYFWNPAVQDDWPATDDRGAIEVRWADGPFEAGVPRPRSGRVMELRVGNRADTPQEVPLLIAVHGPVGTGLQLAQGDAVLGRELIAELVITPWAPDPVERYWRWGMASVATRVTVPAHGHVDVDVVVMPADRDRATDPDDTWVIGWHTISAGELMDELGTAGIHHMQAFQLLNVTENVRWADEVATGYLLPGRAPDGSSTLHQPPAWTYLYAPARELLTHQNASASALLLATLLAIAWLGLRASEDAGGTLHPALGLLTGVGAWQHGRLMIGDGSMNFPDSLYAFGLLASMAALLGGRTSVFVAWAVVTALLRYPGAVVITLGGLALVVLDRALRRKAVDHLVRFGLVLAAFCGAMLLLGLLTGQLETWFFALYFETIPEHFSNNSDALPLLHRPLEFARLAALLGCGVAALAVPFRGLTSRVLLATALLYAPFLAFIDHFSHHYFLPLIALCSAGTAASVAQIVDPRRRAVAASLAAALAVALAWVAWSGRL